MDMIAHSADVPKTLSLIIRLRESVDPESYKPTFSVDIEIESRHTDVGWVI